MFVPMVIAAALAVAPPLPDFRKRLAYLLSWCDSRQIRQGTPRFDTPALLQLFVATTILATSMAAVKAIPASSIWLPARWLAGGIMVLAFAEMATATFVLIPAALGTVLPPLMQSPYRSISVGEFWSKRWNVFTSQAVFGPCIFAPLARHGTALALFMVFLVSGVVHFLLAYMATEEWRISAMWGAFFVVQPLLITIERKLNVRHWPSPAAHAWTLSALAIVAPLFVEPTLQLVEQSWGGSGTILLPTMAVLGFVVIVSVSVSLVSFWSRSGENASMQGGRALRSY